MHSFAEIEPQRLYSREADTDLERTYVMKGSFSDKALETYHLILAPSFRCNLGCKHCYLPDHDALMLPKGRVLQLMDEWSEIVVSERGPFGGIFHLKGGEPLILPYLNDVLDGLEEINTLCFMMTTNGIIGKQEIVDRLSRLNTALKGNVQIIVSIDGSNEKINAQLRGSGNFDKAVAFVRMLQDADIAVFLNNVVHRGNFDDIESFIDLALHLDVQQVNFLSFIPKGYGEQMTSFVPSSIEVFNRVHTVWEKGDEQVRVLLAGSLSDILHAESCGTCTSSECVGGYRGLLYIIPDGTVYSCPNLNHPGLEAGNVAEASLSEIHDIFLRRVYMRICTLKDETGDQYRCKGEEYLPYPQEYVDAGMQRKLNEINGINRISYCFSRNF